MFIGILIIQICFLLKIIIFDFVIYLFDRDSWKFLYFKKYI